MSKMLNKEVGNLVREARLSLGLTQAELGERIGGLGSSAICDLERGNIPWSVARLIEVCRVLGLDTASVMEQVKARSLTAPGIGAAASAT